jgi:hypothetical protein
MPMRVLMSPSRYKAHWRTSPGLGGGRYACNSTTDPYCHHSADVWDHGEQPIVFDIEADPSETLPLAVVPPKLLADLRREKARYEAALQPQAIDPRFGFQWALCCGVGCEAPCDHCTCTNAPLPQPF